MGELTVGVQRADYRKTITLPGAAKTGVVDLPVLFNAAAAVYLTPSVAVYAGYTRGLEESGLAPNNAANRNEALPAIRTRQADAGLRWQMPQGMKLAAGVFDVRKPYFNTDEANVFAVLGDVTHRGIEVSLSGPVTDSLSIVTGVVLMQPRVSGLAVDQGRLGRRPLGQATRILRTNVEYRPERWSEVSFDLAVSNFGSRPASRDNSVLLNGYTTVDLGARYRFRAGDAPATLRVQLSNVADTRFWNVLGGDSYGLTDARRLAASVAVDF